MKIEKLKWREGVPARHQMSEAFCNNAFLALSGGFQDAYTYNTRDGVFSNAQTGNVVLMSQHLMSGEWADALRYLLPLFAFALGVFWAERIQYRYKYAAKLHWRQGILLAEIAILFVVGFIPVEWNMLATFLVSLACAMQVQAFRKVNGYAYASTMCIGNLRSGTEALSKYARNKKPENLKKAMYYFGVIFFFAVGAGIGGNLSLRFGIRMIWICCVLLAVSFAEMFVERI
ncbi:MAG: YoaK family protein [Eubacteriales bacterium]|nr:YoaK family protein [Eubacteriales bacterium]